MASLAGKRTDRKDPWHCGSSGTGRSASMLSGPADAMVFLLMNGPPSAASQDRRKHTVCLWPSHAKGAGLSESGCFIPTCAAQANIIVFSAKFFNQAGKHRRCSNFGSQASFLNRSVTFFISELAWMLIKAAIKNKSSPDRVKTILFAQVSASYQILPIGNSLPFPGGILASGLLPV
ncbi:Formin-Like Protein 1 [Manis pentadactyla]|nr:Formin-Like Protein 1 [Manis pentadactyla]